MAANALPAAERKSADPAAERKSAESRVKRARLPCIGESPGDGSGLVEAPVIPDALPGKRLTELVLVDCVKGV